MAGMKVYRLNNGVEVSQEHLDRWNAEVPKQFATPEGVLKWADATFRPLYQTTAFGLTGLATIDMLAKLKLYVPLIFIDTLHHFPQTMDLLKKVQEKYRTSIYVFKPQGCNNEQEFAGCYGDFLWQVDEDRYDYLAKVEPAHRAYKTLNVSAVLTGRRRSQGGSRSNLQIVEIDELNGIIKINPFIFWSFEQVKEYIDANNVPYNELLDLGYKSIGDYHSTEPIADGEDERSGRWKGRGKTECGIHETSRFAQYLQNANNN